MSKREHPAPPALAAEGLVLDIGEPRRELAIPSFALHEGESLIVEGPSGCGKSTLLRALCRLEPTRAGELRLDGQPAGAVPPRRWRRRLAYLAQRPVMLPGTVRDNLAAPFAVDRLPDTERAAKLDADALAGLLDSVGLPAELLARDARLLSGGETARVALCRALLLRPRALLCDEVTAALDDGHAEMLVARIARYLERGGAVIVVAHDHARWEPVAAGAARIRLGAEPGEAGP